MVVSSIDLRSVHTRRTRAAIRAAALTLTRDRGYAAMTIDDVAALAGVSRRTVFNHFSSKADLLVVGMEPPEPASIEAFVSGDGSLLEDLGDLLVAGAESVESERGWLLSFPEVVRDNPEVGRAIHERLRAIAASLAEAAGRRLGTTSDDPRSRAVVALAMAIQRSAMDLWTDDGPRGEESETPPERRSAPGGPQGARLVAAIRTMTAAVDDVLSARRGLDEPVSRPPD